MAYIAAMFTRGFGAPGNGRSHDRLPKACCGVARERVTGAAARCTGPMRNAIAFAILAVAATSSRTALAQQTCAIRGAHASLAHLRVAPSDGTAPFEVSVDHAPVDATLDASGTAAVHVDHTLTFDATTRSSQLVTYLAHDVDLANDVLHLGFDEALHEVRLDAGDVVGSVAIRVGVFASVRISCAALTLTEPARSSDSATNEGPWRPRESVLRVMDRPGSSTAIDVRIDSDGRIHFAAIETSGRWMRIDVPFGRGSRLHGWVARSSVMPYIETSEPMESDEPPRAIANGRRADEYFGPAVVMASTEVFSRRGGGAWATVSHDARVTVDHIDGDGWVALVGVPGVHRPPDASSSNAWVPLSSVRFPDGVTRSGPSTHGARATQAPASTDPRPGSGSR